MKILATACWHITGHNPLTRVDDYPETIFDKVSWVLDYADENDCRYVLIAGDVFESALIDLFILSRYARLFKEHRCKVLAVFGQHDMRYRTYEKTPLYFFSQLGLIKILDAAPYTDEVTSFYGVSYGDDLVGFEKRDREYIRVLAAHHMVIDNKIWPGQEEGIKAPDLLKKYPGYDLIVTGDNHKTIIAKNKNQLLINSGSLGRTRSNQDDHIPVVVICDLNDIPNYKEVKVPIQPVTEVMDMEYVEEKKAITVDESDGRMDTYVTGIDSSFDMDVSYEKKLDKESAWAVKHGELSEGAFDMIKLIKNKAKGGQND